ncbi:MAG: Anaphase-promoting complex, cyclosome, subunit 3 [Lentisphaerae bacterium ADurb.BinA184]|nr:MAG: Anaphase-promoting complex, cyclosome, subunit 3 [Lentisphaerae bacterium ADurb.BinA184]
MRRRRKLILLAILLIPLGLAATATVLWLSRQSVAHYERRGDELAAAGKYEAAVRVYAVAAQKAERQNARMTKGLGRVVSRALMRIRGRQDLGTGPRDRHRQAELMTKLNRALQRTRSASLDEAFQKSDRSLVLMREAFKLDPAAPGVAAELLDYHHRFAALLGFPATWEALLDTAEAANKALGNQPLILKYRGIARAALAPTRDRTQEELARARDDLAKAIAAAPDDWELIEALARTELLLAGQMKRTGMTDGADQLRQSAYAVVRAPLSRQPDSITARITQLVILLEDGRLNPESADLEQVEARLAGLKTALPEADEPQVRRLARALLAADGPDADGPFAALTPRLSLQAAALLTAHLERHPHDVVCTFLLAGQRWAHGYRDDAVRLYREIAAWDDPPPSALATREGFLVKLMSVEGLAGVLLDDAERAALARKDPSDLVAEVGGLLDQRDLMAARARIAGGQAERLRARERLLQRRPAAAAPLCISLPPETDPALAQALLYSGLCLDDLGESGAAAERLTRALRHPGLTRDQQLIASERLGLNLARLRRWREAAALADQLLRAMPADTRARTTGARILRAVAATSLNPALAAQALDQAKTALEPLAESGDEAALLEAVRVQNARGDRDGAYARLAPYLDRRPDDLATRLEFAALSQAVGRDRELLFALERAAKNSMEAAAEPVTELTRALAQDRLTPEALALAAIAIEGDPATQALRLCRFYFDQERENDALAALERAEAAFPDDERLVALRLKRLLDRRDYAAADTLLNSLASRAVVPYLVLLWRGQLELQRNRAFAAVPPLEAGLKQHPYDSTSLQALARALAETGELDRAVAVSEQATQSRPDDPAGHWLLYSLLDRRGARDAALKALGQAVHWGATPPMVESYLDYRAAWADPGEVIEIRRRLAVLSPGNEANQRALARLLLQRGRADEARPILERLWPGREWGENAVARAEFLAATAGTEAAIAFIEEAIQEAGETLGPGDALTLGLHLQRLGDLDRAAWCFESARRGEPAVGHAAASALAECHWQRRRWADAVILYRQLWQETADFANARRAVAAWIAAGQPAEAWAFVETVLREQGESLDAVLLHARTAAALGRRDLALRDYDRALRLANGDPRPYFDRAEAFFNLPDAEAQRQAETDLARLVRLQPQLARPREMLAALHERAGRFAEAEDELRILQQTYTASDLYRLWQCRLLVKTRHFTEADRMLSLPLTDASRRGEWHRVKSALREAEGHPGNAIAEILRAYARDASVGDLFTLCRLLLSSGRADLVRHLLDPLPPEAEAHAGLLMLLFRALDAGGHHEAALAAIERAVAVPPRADSGVSDAELVRALAEELPAAAVLRLNDTLRAANAEPSRRLLLAAAMTRKGLHGPAAAALTDLLAALPADSPLRRDVRQGLAMACWADGDAPRAEALFREVLAEQPDDATVLNNLAYLLATDAARPAEAVDLAKRALLRPAAKEASRHHFLDTLGVAHLALKDLALARDALDSAVKLKPSADGHLHMAQLSIEEQDYAEALRHLDVAERLARDGEAAATLEEILELRAQLGTGVVADDRVAVARVHLRTGNAAAARRIVDRVLEKDAAHWQARLMRLRILAAEGEAASLAAAVEDMLSEARAGLPAEECLELARTLRELRQDDAAVAAYRAVGGEAERLQALAELAALQTEQGRPADAVTTFEELCAADPGPDPAAHLAELQLEADNVTAATEAIAELRRRDPAHPRLPDLEIRLAVRQRDEATVRQAANTIVLRLDQTDPDPFCRAAEFLLGLAPDDADGIAARLLDAALTHTPGHPLAKRLRADLARTQGDSDLALALLAELVYDHPLDIEAVAALGDCFAQTARRSELAALLECYGPLWRDLPALRSLQAAEREGKGDTEGAERLLETVNAESPTAATILRLGALRRNRGDRAAALDELARHPEIVAASAPLLALRTALLMETGGPAASDSLRECLRQLPRAGRRDRRAALETLRGAVRIPQLPETVLPLVHPPGVDDETLESLLRALAPAPGDRETLAALERLLKTGADTAAEVPAAVLVVEHSTHCGDFARAEEVLRSLCAKYPQEPRAWDARARFLLATGGDRAQALDYARKATTRLDGAPAAVRADCLETLAQVQKDLGLGHLALASLQRSVQAYPGVDNRLRLATMLIERGEGSLAQAHLHAARRAAIRDARPEALAEIDRRLATAGGRDTPPVLGPPPLKPAGEPSRTPRAGAPR